MYLLKEWNIPLWAESPDDGRYSIKEPKAIPAGIMQMSEGRCAQDGRGVLRRGSSTNTTPIPGPIGNPPPAENWAAYIFNVVHDRLDAECARSVSCGCCPLRA